MSVKLRVQARRFITMIDTFYDHHTRVIFSAEVPPDQLFCVERIDGIELEDDNRKLFDDLGIRMNSVSFVVVGDARLKATHSVAFRHQETSSASIFSGEEEIFAFERALSRIVEMQSSAYWNVKNPI